jgi:arylsulfatase A-like enzyme
LPTLADLAGLKPLPGIDGISVLPTLLSKKQNTVDRFLYWEFPSGGFKQAVRWRNYKAIRLAPDKPLELYDLEKDLAEQNNIAGDNPDVVAKTGPFNRLKEPDDWDFCPFSCIIRIATASDRARTRPRTC